MQTEEHSMISYTQSLANLKLNNTLRVASRCSKTMEGKYKRMKIISQEDFHRTGGKEVSATDAGRAGNLQGLIMCWLQSWPAEQRCLFYSSLKHAHVIYAFLYIFHF